MAPRGPPVPWPLHPLAHVCHSCPPQHTCVTRVLSTRCLYPPWCTSQHPKEMGEALRVGVSPPRALWRCPRGTPWVGSPAWGSPEHPRAPQQPQPRDGAELEEDLGAELKIAPGTNSSMVSTWQGGEQQSGHVVTTREKGDPRGPAPKSQPGCRSPAQAKSS